MPRSSGDGIAYTLSGGGATDSRRSRPAYFDAADGSRASTTTG